MTKKEFEERISEWIHNERSFLQEWKSGECKPISSIDSILERIEFNVMEAFYDYIYPEPCPECGRSGRDHDGECSLFGEER